MRDLVPCLRSNLLLRVAAIALLSGGTAGCSSDSSRFGDDPFSNPFATASAEPRRQPRPAPEPDTTASFRAAPTSRIERAPLGAPSAAQSATMRGFEGQQSARRAPEPHSTGSIGPIRSTPTRPGASNWTAEGGTTVTLGEGDSVHTLSQRYGVPASAIMQANGLQSADGVSAGSRIVIPVYSVGGRAAAAPVEAPRAQIAAAPPVAPALAPVPAPTRVAATPARTSGGSHLVESGETLSSVARQYGVSRTELAEANGLTPDTMVRSGQKLTVPGGVAASRIAQATVAPGQQKMQFVPGPSAKGAAVAAAPTATAPAAASTAPKTTLSAVPAPKPNAKTAAAPALKPNVSTSQAQAFASAPAKPTGAPQPSDEVKTASVKVDPAPEAAPTGPSLRWPVRGRVISAYGAKASGAANEGINLAVPEGTEVKASDDGVVAYSGSELKGFGNLVLIRHSNGWVTAYAHNSALNVKRGETIRRGQIIAKSGSTGNVSSPQLHFEVRKGATPVDPLGHLPGV